MKRCAHCNDEIETDEWYPVATSREDGDALQLHAFCDETCQNNWLKS